MVNNKICPKCKCPRRNSGSTCFKCRSELIHDPGIEWAIVPDIGRIRELAREVGYAIAIHGTLERDVDLIAAPWIEEAVSPSQLAEHISSGIGGHIVYPSIQSKPHGRWVCFIVPPGNQKVIDLSVMPRK